MEFYIDLYKAIMNFAKLVKKPVQVRGKNGQVFTRMQWVSPEDASTGHGMRKISSPEGLEMAKKDGIHKHPHFHEAMKEQGVNPEHFDKTHPHFFVPETEESASKWKERTSFANADDVMTHMQKVAEEQMHHRHYSHANIIDHDIIDEHPSAPKAEQEDKESLNSEDEYEAFLKKHNIHPEIDHLIRDVVHSVTTESLVENGYPTTGHYPSFQVHYISEGLHKHFHTIKKHLEDDIKQNTKDTVARNIQLGCLREGHVKHNMLAAAHPHIAKATVDHVLGKDLANKFRGDLDKHNLCINFPGSRVEKYKTQPYKASTMLSTIERNHGQDGVDQWEEIVNDGDLDARGQVDALEDLDEDIYYRADAEYKAMGLELEDRKPVYIAYNPLGLENGSATYYGNRWMKIDDSVLSESTASFDDTFNDTRSVPKVFSMDHLKDMFILKSIEKHPSMAQIRLHGEDDDNYAPWHAYQGDIPFEIQYHQPIVSNDKFEIMPDPAEKYKNMSVDEILAEKPGADYNFDDTDDLEWEDEDGEIDFDDLDDLELDDDDDLEDFNPDTTDDLDLEENASWDDLFNWEDKKEDKK